MKCTVTLLNIFQLNVSQAKVNSNLNSYCVLDLYSNFEAIKSKGVKLYKLLTCLVDVHALLDTVENNDIDLLWTVPRIE
jgi:hypothetical protein